MEQIVNNENFSDKFEPVMQLTVYKCNSEIYIEKEHFMRKDNNYALSGKMPMTIHDLKNLAEAYYSMKDERTGFFKGLIPQEVIYCDNMKVVWMCEPKKRNLIFEGISFNYAYPNPPLIFKYAMNGTLSVCALKSSEANFWKKNILNLEICMPPYPNIYQSMEICMGDVEDCPSKYYDEIAEYYTKAFFESVFSDLHATVVKGNFKAVYEEIRNKDVFPEERLIQTKKTVKDFIHKI